MALPVSELPEPAPAGGCGVGRCGTDPGRIAGLPEDMRRRVENHPCYSEDAHRYFARMHAAVAPACNIQCNYCNRKYDCANESRPGVVSEVLTPEQAVRKTLAVAAAIPQLSVLGIAGPGDPLANPERTFATFRLLAEKAPDIKLCVSTNGLTLPQHADELARHNIEHVTITINCIDSDVGAEIYPWIFWRNRRVRGRAAAAILIEQQQKGLEKLVERGILVKINSVMIPGVNDEHLEAVSRTVKAKGAFLHNVMPLISDAAHGTLYGVMGQRAPTAAELARLQDACAGDMRMMRHCRQCRADAVGLLGEDRGDEFTMEKIAAIEVDHEAALARRVAFRAEVAAEREAPRSAVETVATIVQPLVFHRPAKAAAGRPVLIAVASKGGGVVNEHFGHAREFLIYEAGTAGARLVERRAVDVYCRGREQCDEEADVLSRTIGVLQGCEAVVCAKIGIEPWGRLEAAGIVPDGEHGMEKNEDAVMAVWRGLLTTGQHGRATDGRAERRISA